MADYSKALKLSTYTTVTFNYSVTETATATTYTLKTVSFANSRSTGTTQKLYWYVWALLESPSQGTMVKQFTEKTVTLNKGTKSKSVSVNVSATIQKGTSSTPAWMFFRSDMDTVDYATNWTKEAYYSHPAAALATYSVSYNANGGSGAPASQTKTYGRTLTLSSTKPTRTNHQFLGWATSAGATSAAYQPGGSYTANAAVTLYAVWQQVYASPALAITRSYRCDANGDVADEGTYAAVELSWSTWAANSVTALTATVNGVTVARSAMTQSVAADGKSGTAKAVVNAGMGANLSYAVSASITDSGCATSGVTGSSATTTRADSISEAYFPMDFLAGGHGAGIGTPATEEGALRIAHKIRQLDSGGNTVFLADRSGNLSISGSLSQGSDRRLKLHVRDLVGDADALAFVRSLQPALYRKGGGLHAGFYAQDVEESDPFGTEAVTVGEGGYLALDYTALIAPLVAYAQALEGRIEAIEKAIGGDGAWQ